MADENTHVPGEDNSEVADSEETETTEEAEEEESDESKDDADESESKDDKDSEEEAPADDSKDKKDKDDSDKKDEDESDEDEEEDDAEDDDEDDDESKDGKEGGKRVSIYDAYKGKKQEVRSLKTQISELQQIIEKGGKSEAQTAKVSEALKSFAETQGMKPEAVTEFVELMRKELGSDFAEAMKQVADITNSRKIEAEDAEVMKSKDFVKAELGINEDAELSAVMKEVVRLSHTKAFADKEVEYIIWKNKSKLAKMVSPKKPGFETGDNKPVVEDGEADFGADGGITPGQAQAGMHSKRDSGLSIKHTRS